MKTLGREMGQPSTWFEKKFRSNGEGEADFHQCFAPVKNPKWRLLCYVISQHVTTELLSALMQPELQCVCICIGNSMICSDIWYKYDE